MTTATEYICFKCFSVHKGRYCPKCTTTTLITTPKKKTVWTKRKVYYWSLVEYINYGELDEDGNMVMEDRGDSNFYELNSWEEAQTDLQNFEPYTTEDGDKVFKLGLEVEIHLDWYRNGEIDHDEYVDTIDVDCAPKYIQRLAAKILK